MRLHLYHCLEASDIKPFPHKKFYIGDRNSIKNVIYSFLVHCHCGMPEMKGFPWWNVTSTNSGSILSVKFFSEEVLDAIVRFM